MASRRVVVFASVSLGLPAGSKIGAVTHPPPVCANGALDDGEGDIDCGGSCASKGKIGQRCNLEGDCTTSL